MLVARVCGEAWKEKRGSCTETTHLPGLERQLVGGAKRGDEVVAGQGPGDKGGGQAIGHGLGAGALLEEEGGAEGWHWAGHGHGMGTGQGTAWMAAGRMQHNTRLDAE